MGLFYYIGIKMAVYYNEIDSHAIAWLKELIKENLLPRGDIDERSICDVKSEDLKNYSQCHFFAGVGGWPLALRQAGWPQDRQVWTGSCPCQPFSSAQGGKQKGFKDKRHLWPEFYRLIRECHPNTIFGEQVASKDGLVWLDTVCTDMENTDYAIGACDSCAAGYGAPHIRQRLYWVAYSISERDGKGGYQGGRIRNGKISTDTLDVTAQITSQTRQTASGESATGYSAETRSGGQLNPDLSRWLMGFSADHLSCGVTAMRLSFPKQRRS